MKMSNREWIVVDKKEIEGQELIKIYGNKLSVNFKCAK